MAFCLRLRHWHVKVWLCKDFNIIITQNRSKEVLRVVNILLNDMVFYYSIIIVKTF